MKNVKFENGKWVCEHNGQFIEIDKEQWETITKKLTGIGLDSEPQVDRHGIQADRLYSLNCEIEVKWEMLMNGEWKECGPIMGPASKNRDIWETRSFAKLIFPEKSAPYKANAEGKIENVVFKSAPSNNMYQMNDKDWNEAMKKESESADRAQSEQQKIWQEFWDVSNRSENDAEAQSKFIISRREPTK